MSQTCVVFAAGTYYGNEPSARELPDHAFVVAADGGLDHVCKADIRPNLAIGDFDSAKTKVPQDIEVITLPPEHDDPDMLSALKVGWSRGCRDFRIYGGLGGRLDHTIANIQLLALLARNGGHGLLYGEHSVITAICNGSMHFPAHALHLGDAVNADNRMVSVFSHSDVSHGVTETGLKYELQNGTMHNDTVLGVSNELLDDRSSTISVADGTLIVTFPTEAASPTFKTEIKSAETLGPLASHVSALLNKSR
ncbi:thiamine diphosphokinase [Bifidobacterium sp. ESL0682]|uniref:thiamine diphosphokinase n=1 Tax=Bifidobacterium sp. ESL0682 TaxID=2983212 RepID=UPI0023F8D17D|nr:thiamine diphosphokinase [Bifidobacterium sp. ESL0682]WEV41554.1 thiamine diphosphokinase [Bifidobacterium sp. ESL0682]